MKFISVSSFVAAFSAAFLLSACSNQPKPLYNYGDYSDSYYGAKKNVSEESALELQKAIEFSIENTAEGSSERVPPGMYANLGYMHLKSGKNAEAISYFEKEKSTYPESAHFMDRMIQKVHTLEGEKK
jgi:hypothetical protein